RLRLGDSGLLVSPVCLGKCGSPETVLAAFEAGINFFFLSGDLHFSHYEATRAGLRRLLAQRPSARSDIIITITNYARLNNTILAAPYLETLEVMPEIERVDV